MKNIVGKIIAPSKLNIQEHEMNTARAIADAGYDVEFMHRTEGERITSADVVINGVLWEVKSPQSGSAKALERNIRKASKQSHNIIIDSQRVKGVSDREFEKRIRCICLYVKGIRRLWFVNRDRKIIDIK